MTVAHNVHNMTNKKDLHGEKKEKGSHNMGIRDLSKIDLSKFHDCEKCHGKIISVSIDHVGVMRCGYCNEVVDYRRREDGE